MNLKILVAEAQEILRVGLCTLLKSDSRVSEVHEAIHAKDLQHCLTHYKADLIIVNQDLLADISVLETKNFVVLATEPNITSLKAAYEYGARGYLSVNASAELLRSMLRPTRDAFLIEPTLVPLIMDYLFDKKESYTSNRTLLTPREREIVNLLHEGYDKVSIARKLCITETTLKTHLKNIAKKRTLAAHLRMK